MKKQLLIMLAIFSVSFSAHSIVELRAGYGVQTPSDDEVGTNTLKSMSGFNLDAIVELPMLPFGFGLRYEDMGFDVGQLGGPDLTSSFQRTSLLINYRIIDLFLYFGVIGSLGFVNDMNVDFGGGLEANWDSSLTYSVGVEGGVSFGLIMVGAELGYLSANLEDADNLGNVDADLSGIYAKALVGVGF